MELIILERKPTRSRLSENIDEKEQTLKNSREDNGLLMLLRVEYFQ